MTAPKELHDRLDQLSPEGWQAVLATIEQQERIRRHLEALTAFQTGWTPEEQAAWDEGTKRRPSQTTHSEEEF